MTRWSIEQGRRGSEMSKKSNVSSEGSAAPANKNRESEHVLPLKPEVKADEFTPAQSATTPSATSPEAKPADPLATFLAAIIAPRLADAWRWVSAAVSKKAWAAVIGAVSTVGLASGYAVLGNTAEVRDYVGYTPALKPQRECSKPLPNPPSMKEIDEHLRDPSNYTNETHMWRFTFDRQTEAFSGSQGLGTLTNQPIRVSGHLIDRDWIGGSIRGKKGRGTFNLNARDNEDIYRGYMIALDCSLPIDVVLVCPYVLGPAEKITVSDPFLQGKYCRRWDELNDESKLKLAGK
jgi:hypothetical protein